MNAGLSLVADGQADPVLRRRRFEETHRDVTIVPPARPADRWRAVVPAGKIPGHDLETTLGAWELADLMDQLDVIYPDGGEGTASQPDAHSHP